MTGKVTMVETGQLRLYCEELYETSEVNPHPQAFTVGVIFIHGGTPLHVSETHVSRVT